MCSGLDEWGQVEDFIMPRQTDSLPKQEGSMTCSTPRKNTPLCVQWDLSLKLSVYLHIYLYVCVCVCVVQVFPWCKPKHTCSKLCSCKCNSFRFVLPVYAYFYKVCGQSVSHSVGESVCSEQGNYSMSCVGVWLMRFWSKGWEQRCPGFGPEAQLLIWAKHSYSHIHLTDLRLLHTLQYTCTLLKMQFHLLDISL